jgi:magnesium-transporting ATPase (P-type)
MAAFRADSVTMWVQILKRLFVLNLDVREDILENFRIPKFRYVLQILRLPANDNMALWAGLILIMLAALLICLLFPNNYERTYKRNVVSLVFTWVILVICIISLSSVSTFLYFNF